MKTKIYERSFTEDELFVMEQVVEYFLLRNPDDDEVRRLLEEKLKI